MISGRAWWSMLVISASVMRWRNLLSSATRPCMIWTKPASSEPPSSIIDTSSDWWISQAPSMSDSAPAHHMSAPGIWHASSHADRESKRTTPTKWSSSVKP